ncbi:hypothetical protein ABZX51_003738 [Aspergillus tubingensis]
MLFTSCLTWFGDVENRFTIAQSLLVPSRTFLPWWPSLSGISSMNAETLLSRDNVSTMDYGSFRNSRPQQTTPMTAPHKLSGRPPKANCGFSFKKCEQGGV